MIILKSQSQVRSFVKRQKTFHNKHTACTKKFSDDPEDPNCYGIKTSIVIDGKKVLLESWHFCSGERGHTTYDVLAIIKILSK